MDTTEKRPTILPPAAVEPCDENLRNSSVDWDAILAGGPVSRESCKQAAGLVHLQLFVAEYDALAAEVNGDPVPENVKVVSESSEMETVRPLPYKQAS
jgi:hypothetical protein